MPANFSRALAESGVVGHHDELGMSAGEAHRFLEQVGDECAGREGRAGLVMHEPRDRTLGQTGMGAGAGLPCLLSER